MASSGANGRTQRERARAEHETVKRKISSHAYSEVKISHFKRLREIVPAARERQDLGFTQPIMDKFHFQFYLWKLISSDNEKHKGIFM